MKNIFHSFRLKNYVLLHSSKATKIKAAIFITLIVIVIATTVNAFITIKVDEGTFGSPDFRIIASDYSNERFCDIAHDGTCVVIDTNPYNITDKNDISAELAISHINDVLGFDDSLYYRMEHTTALDGKQKEENRKAIVEWSYHPQNGLEVLYTAK